MGIKKTLLGVTALAVLAFAALPAFASAHWSVDYPGVDGHFTTLGGTATLRAQSNIQCTTSTGTGHFTSTRTGVIELTFHGCHETLFGTSCQSSGQPNGTITTTELVFHTVTIKGAANPKGILITSNAGHFATFSCPTVGITVRVGGNGIIGQVTSPGYEELSETATLSFTAASTVQTFQETEGGGEGEGEAGTKWHLTSSINGGAPAEASEEGSGTLTFTEGSGELTPN